MFNPPITGDKELDAFLAQLVLEGTSGGGSDGLSADLTTGVISDQFGNLVAYLYKYIAVKYADDNVGTNISNVPTNRLYYGLKNSDSSVESNNPADYRWFEVTGGFGTTKFLWYLSVGGRKINFSVSTTAPATSWLQEPGVSIDLDIVTSAPVSAGASTFLSFFTPATMQVPRAGNPLAPVFTNVTPRVYATNQNTIVQYSGATTDSDAAFTNNTWRIGASSTTGLADISYTNITMGSPTDAGSYAQFPAPSAMASSPATISVPIRYKDSAGVVTQSSVASLQLVFSDPGTQGATGTSGPSIDISGYTSFVQASSGAFTPPNAVLTALTTNVTSPTYSWSVSGATPASGSLSTITVTPLSAATKVDVTLTVNGSNLASPLSKTISMPVVYNGVPGQAGANGVMSAFPSIYRWTANSTPPARPTTTSTYTWATGAYTPPTDWYTSAPSETTAGYYLWSITVPLNEAATVVSSTLDWTNVSNPIRGIAYNGANGATGGAGSATFVITRVANDGGEPTNPEVLAAIGRTPVAGDIATVSYNNFNLAAVYRFSVGWTLFTSYITGSLIVENTITASKLSVSALSAITANIGTVTAGEIQTSGFKTATTGQRIEINSLVPPSTTVRDNRISAYDSANSKFLTMGGGGGSDVTNAVIGISGGAGVTNPIWLDYSANTGSGLTANTSGTGNGLSAVSSGNGRLYYGALNNNSNPDAAFRVDVVGSGHTNPVFMALNGSSTGAAFFAGGSGNGYAFDGVSGTSGTAGTKSGIGYFRGFDLPSDSSGVVTPGTYASITMPSFNFETEGSLVFNVTLENSNYNFYLEYDSELLNTTQQLADAIASNIENKWAVTASGTINSTVITFRRATVGLASGTNTATMNAYTGVLNNGTDPIYGGSTVVRVQPPPNDVNKVLRGNGTWGVTSASGGITNIVLTAPTGFSVTGSPLTANGTLALGYSGQIPVTSLGSGTATNTNFLRGDGVWSTVTAYEHQYNVKAYGAIGNGSTDDTSAIQSAINAATITGGVVYFPNGTYRITSSLTYTSPANADPYARVHFLGDGINASSIYQTTAGATALSLACNTGNPSATPPILVNPNVYTMVENLTFVGSGGDNSRGISISGGAFFHFKSCFFTNWGYGVYGANFLTSNFDSCFFRFNLRGALFERIPVSGQYATSPNAINMFGCEFGVNSLYGIFVNGPGVFNMIGGAIEVNGTTTGDVNNWGLRIAEPSGNTAIESSVGFNLSGVYFEGNLGIADLYATSTFAKPGVSNAITGCSFNRVGSTPPIAYATNNIKLEATSGSGFKVAITGCGFKGLGGYTPTGARPTIANTNCTIDLTGCAFDSAVDAYTTNSVNRFESGLQTPTLTDLSGLDYGYTTVPNASGTAATGSATKFARGDHVHPLSVTTASAFGSGALAYNNTSGVLTFTPPVVSGSGTVNTGNSGQVAYYAANGTAVNGNSNITINGFDLFSNETGATNARFTSNLAGITSPGFATNASNIVLAAGYSGTSTYSAGVLVNAGTAGTTPGPNFSGNASSGTRMNLGTSVAPWGIFNWGSAAITAPTSGGTGYLRQDGTWASITSGGVTSVSGTGSGLGFSLTGTVTSTGNLTLNTPTVSALQSSLGLGALAYVSSLTDFTQLNSTALASNVSSSGNRILATASGARTWATMSEVRAALGENGGSPSSSTFLRGDGTWSTPSTGGTGTVTSVSGTGTVSGLSLSGTVTTSGNLTLGGSLSLTSGNVTGALGYTPLSTSGQAADSAALGGYGPGSWGRIFNGNPGFGGANAAGSGMNIITGTGLVGTYNFFGSGNTLTLQAVSDKRLKDDIQDEALGLDFVTKLRPVTFTRSDIEQTTKFHGFLADDVQLLVTDTNDSLNQTHENGIKSLDYIGLISVLTKAVQELNIKVNQLTTRINELENK